MNGIRVSFLALTLSACYAETIQSVRGSIQTNSLTGYTPLVVVLESTDPFKGGSESSVSADGSFEFKDVTSGMHRLRVSTNMGETVDEELVDVAPSRPLSIHLSDRSSSKPVSGLVSAKRLLHPTPKKALRAFADAQKESEKGRTAEAAGKLELAVSLDPDYFEARCNLGVQYMRMGRRVEAAEQFEKAAASAPPSAPVYGNLAVAYLSIGKFGEAADSARRALELNRSHPAAHFVLGSILARSVSPSSTEKAQEAVSQLRQGAAVSPKVHMEIARINAATGDHAGAREELRLYLQTGDPTYRMEAERLLAGD